VEPSTPLLHYDRGTRCPCCGNSVDSKLLEKIPYREIWNRLREDWGASFSEEVIRRNTLADETALFECEHCGVQFFDPAAAGDAEFYRELGESPRYYSPSKWEFDWVRSRLPPSAEVLDVGCGRGDFLAAIAPVTRRAVGMDWSPSAVAQARGRGLEAIEADLVAQADGFEGAFTAICAFHILEHLQEPVPFLRLLRRCLRPGGSIFLSVPNRFRSSRSSLEPLDCPPHHLTRWSPASLERFVGWNGLRVVEFATEPVDVSVPRDRLRERILSATSGIPAAGEFLGTWISRVAWRIAFFSPLLVLYRRLGVLERSGYYGMSIAVRCEETSL
jgi:SAM-dependent methyltransferase